MIHSDIEYLSVPLPGDILRLREAGYFDRMNRVIDERVKTDIPEALKKRLLLEKKKCALLPAAYPFTRAEAEKILRDEINDFRSEELDMWRDMDAADWIFVEGKEMFRKNFLNTLIKTRPEIAARAIKPERNEYAAENAAILERAISIMKEKGEMAVKMRIRASVYPYEEMEREGKRIRAYIPIPVEGAQAENIEIHACSEGFVRLSDSSAPHRTAFFEAIYKKGMRFWVEYSFINRVKYVNPDPANVCAEQPDFFLEEKLPHIRFTPYFRMLAKEIVGEETNPLIKAKKIYDWITSVPIYSYMPPYFTLDDIPAFMATRLKGDCGIFATLFITLCRICGIPARWQSGLYATPIEIGDHDWAQFYIAPYGWMFADCSFGNTAHRHDAESRREFYFGNLEPYRVPTTRDIQCEFDPPMLNLRYDPYDNQEGEAEYEDGIITNSLLHTDQEMISIEEI